MKYLFLQSHGMRSPLTAIRWASNRLRKKALGNLNAEQQRLVSHIHDNAKKLSVVLDSMFLLAQAEDQRVLPEKQEICLRDLIHEETERSGGGGGVRWKLRVPHLHVLAHREVLEAIIRNLCAVYSEQTDDAKRAVFVDVETDQGFLLLGFRSALLLPILEDGSGRSEAQDVKVIGGLQGVMLSLSDELAGYLGGRVEMEEVITGEFVEDGTVELENDGSDEQRVLLRLPMQCRVVEGECSRRSVS
jgi:light-regulated signal transduction histidine kinase (bacteriophytochrome)